MAYLKRAHLHAEAVVLFRGDPALLVEVGIICWHDLLSSLKLTPLLLWEPSLLRSKKPAWVTQVQENRIDIFCSYDCFVCLNGLLQWS